MKQGRGGYVVLQRLRGDEWRVLGEADRSPGLPLGTFAVTQFGTSWGARQLQRKSSPSCHSVSGGSASIADVLSISGIQVVADVGPRSLTCATRPIADPNAR